MYFETPAGNAEILYEDGDVICFVKPAGVLSQKTGEEESVLELASVHTGGAVYPVHRLDRGTLGVMLAAKSKAAAGALSALIARGCMTKEYLAAVNGVPAAREGVLEDDLFFDRRRDKSFAVKKGSGRRGVKHAVLEYKTVAVSENVSGRPGSLLRIKLYTGRTHQIRVQTANMGHPLLGDGKYGGGNSRYGCSLCAFRLTVDGEALRGSALSGHPVSTLAAGGQAVFEHIPKGGVWECFTFDENVLE